MAKNSAKSFRRGSTKKKSGIYVIGIAILMLAVSTTLFYISRHRSSLNPIATNNTQLQNQSSDSQSDLSSAKSANNPSGPNNNTNSPVSPGSTGIFSGVLIRPYGRFVSQHYPNSVDYIEQSACITSASVTCSISFSLGGKVITLPTKVTDGSGTAYWTWTPKQYGLSSGSWTIVAVAKANGKTETTIDPNGKLVIP